MGLQGTEESSNMPANCTKLNITVNTSSDCSSFSWAMAYSNESTDNCTAVPYTGSLCELQFLMWQECVGREELGMFLDVSIMESSQEEKERDVAQFLHFLRKFDHFYCQRSKAES